ncbi:MAG: aldo/keto reductase [Anaerolineae bacterium]|nr:aldo/keto reductase [Anaerolineae bacterium]
MTGASLLPRVQIGRSKKMQLPLGMGGSFYGLDHRNRQGEAELIDALETALEYGIIHFDTATGYGDGYSERLLGRLFGAVPERRERVFLASKANLDDISAQAITAAIDASRQRLQTDYIDLYYLHWPRTGRDMRPWMEGLETARQQGKIAAIGVSNFTVPQMQALAEVGQIDAYQLGYNLLWRFSERDVLPYCAEHQIAVVAYSALAHGILAGKYARKLDFVPNDQRWTITLFKETVWPQVYDTVETFKAIARQGNYDLGQLALRWLLRRPAVTSVLVSAKNRAQLLANYAALTVDIPDAILDELTVVSDRALQFVPDEGNPFGYHP